MGLRFRKSIKIAPGVKINLNKKSTSVTFGGKGVHYTASSTGKKTASVGIPGTGISYTKTTGQSSKQKKTSEGGSQPMPTAPQSNFQDPDHKKWYQKTGWIIALLILFFPVGLFLMWKYTNWKKPVKGIITALILIIALSGIVSPDKLEQITLKADTEQTYDINQKISIEATTTPSDYELSSSDFKCSGGKITSNNQNISFIATKDGSYKIWAEHDGIKSNNLTLKVEDKAAIAKQKAKEEQERLAAEKAKEKAAQEAAEAQAKLKRRLPLKLRHKPKLNNKLRPLLKRKHSNSRHKHSNKQAERYIGFLTDRYIIQLRIVQAWDVPLLYIAER